MSARTQPSSSPARARAAGFSLVELLVSMTIMLVVIGSVFTLVDPSQGISKTQPEVSDMQQRMRIAADSIEKDLLMAGAGTYSGAIAGALANFFPPILPRRTGSINPDAELTFFDDRISIAYVPDTAAQTDVRDAMPQPSSEIKVTQEPGCPISHPLCGFDVGMRVVIFDDTGSWDIFTITEVQESSLHLQHRPPNPDFTKAYTPAEHARISMVENHVYWQNQGVSQLNHYDGFLEDVPIVDNMVQVRFTYFGDPNPPLAPRPVTGAANCIFDAAGNPTLPVLPSNGSSLVELTPAMLTDGPVCGAAPNRFDADLYRVRKVRVDLRVQAGLQELRGANPTSKTLFVNPGTSNSAYRRVPDYSMSFEVAPRNMNLVR
jgi:prepilin-type N-terminal cleavage/methylation domain-containing protein